MSLLENSAVDKGLLSWRIMWVFLVNSRVIRAVNPLDLVKSKHKLDHVQLDILLTSGSIFRNKLDSDLIMF